MSISRRQFLIGTGLVGGGLVLGLGLGDKAVVPGTVPGSFQPNAWLQITSDGRVIFQLHKVEMGQGVMTSLATIIGEELDFDPAAMTVELAGVHPDFDDPENQTQITGGSTSIKNSWQPLREAGAAARAMLVAAAAQRWSVARSDCHTDNGVVINTLSEERLTYAELASAARELGSVDYQLKSAQQYRWIGKSIPRLDAVAKSTGRAQYGVDVIKPQMKIAVVVRSPHFGGSVKSWQVSSVDTRPGVIAAFPIHSGIAIVADSYWQARTAANGLQVEWDKGPLAGLDSAAIRQGHQRALAEETPHWVKEQGDVAASLDSAATVLKAEYGVPYTHHSPMEPQNATALYSGDRMEIWAPNQVPDVCRAVAAHFTGIKQDNITVNTTLLGGGFGRRGYPDFVGEAAAVALQLPDRAIKLMWSREDDMQHDYYRPATYHGLQAGLDDSGKLVAWQHTLASTSILQGYGVNVFSALLPSWVPTTVARATGKFIGEQLGGIDPTMAEGATVSYQVENMGIGQVLYDPGIPTGFWRSVGFSHNCFAAESFLDEVAHAAHEDPVAIRQRLLDPDSRSVGVLKLVTEKAAWGKPSANVSQGIAVVEPFNSYCAMVVEVSVQGTDFTVERVVAAVDCGLPINPEIIKAQVESAIVYGLTAAIKAPVTIKGGRVEQSNFHDLPVLRINETPLMEVYIVESMERPTGIGEIGVPGVAPALANALFAATGQRLRELPLKLS